MNKSFIPALLFYHSAVPEYPMHVTHTTIWLLAYLIKHLYLKLIGTGSIALGNKKITLNIQVVQEG